MEIFIKITDPRHSLVFPLMEIFGNTIGQYYNQDVDIDTLHLSYLYLPSCICDLVCVCLVLYNFITEKVTPALLLFFKLMLA